MAGGGGMGRGAPCVGPTAPVPPPDDPSPVLTSVMPTRAGTATATATGSHQRPRPPPPRRSPSMGRLGIPVRRHSPELTRAHNRPSPPWRIGFSTKVHDSAARATIAPTWTTARSGFTPDSVVGVVSVMTGNCQR